MTADDNGYQACLDAYAADPDWYRNAYRVLFAKVLGHRDTSEGPCPRCEPEVPEGVRP